MNVCWLYSPGATSPLGLRRCSLDPSHIQSNDTFRSNTFQNILTKPIPTRIEYLIQLHTQNQNPVQIQRTVGAGLCLTARIRIQFNSEFDSNPIHPVERSLSKSNSTQMPNQLQFNIGLGPQLSGGRMEMIEMLWT